MRNLARPVMLASVVFAFACSDDESAGGGGASGGTSGAAGGGATGGAAATSGTSAGGSGGTGGSAGAGGGPSVCGTASAASIRDCVEQSRLETNLAFVAKERVPGTSHWQAVQDLCKSTFESNGFTVELHTYATGVNVIGVKTGTEKPDERVLLSAHYDHISGCAGADDNATGTVGVLEAARVMGPAKFARTVVLACWDEEERGLIGARAYAARAQQNAENIVVMYSLEMIGFTSSDPNSQRYPAGFDLLFPEQLMMLAARENRADFLAILPDTAAVPAAESLAQHGREVGLDSFVLEISDGLKANPVAADVQRSDHAAFWAVNIPAILVTDTSEFRYDPYHCRNGLTDEIANLDAAFLTKNVKASVGSAADAAEVR